MERSSTKPEPLTVLPPAQSKIKVLHLITLSVVGGSQDNTFCTAEGHDRARYEVHVACNPSGQWIERARCAGDVFHALPALVTPIRPLQDLRTLLALIGLFRREKFQIVHTHTAKAGFLGRLAGAICRVPLVIHTYHAFPFHDFMGAWKRRFYVLLERAMRPWTDFFITVSENERENGRLSDVLVWDRSRTVYSGIDFTRLDKPSEATKVRTALSVPARAQMIIMAGRLDAQKAPHLMIEAFAEIAGQFPDSILVMAGDGELRPLVEARIAAHGLHDRIRLLGFRSDVPELLQAADIFALSSLYEGMGRAMTEAMLLGKPVVVPNTNGIPEIVRHGETGLLYTPGSVTELAEQLCRLLASPADQERLGKNARQLTRDVFDVSVMVKQIEAIYEQLLTAPRREVQPVEAMGEQDHRTPAAA